MSHLIETIRPGVMQNYSGKPPHPLGIHPHPSIKAPLGSHVAPIRAV